MTLNWLAGPICINGTKASSRTLAKRTASIGFLMSMAPSIWLKFDFRGKRTQTCPWTRRRGPAGQIPSGFGIRISQRNTTAILVKSWRTDMGHEKSQASQEKQGLALQRFRAPPILGTLRSYRGNGDSGQSGNSRKPGSRKYLKCFARRQEHTKDQRDV